MAYLYTCIWSCLSVLPNKPINAVRREFGEGHRIELPTLPSFDFYCDDTRILDSSIWIRTVFPFVSVYHDVRIPSISGTSYVMFFFFLFFRSILDHGISYLHSRPSIIKKNQILLCHNCEHNWRTCTKKKNKVTSYKFLLLIWLVLISGIGQV